VTFLQTWQVAESLSRIGKRRTVTVENEAVILACDILDAIADHRGLWPAMVFASEMLVAISAKIEGEVGPAEARSVLQLILERTTCVSN
jgi:hypothetical protein